MSKKHHGVGQCPECNQWSGFATNHLDGYTYKCPICQHTAKIKDNQKGGLRINIEFTESRQDSRDIAQILNKKNSPRIQNIVKQELQKPPHRRRDINNLIEDVEPSTDFKTYTTKS